MVPGSDFVRSDVKCKGYILKIESCFLIYWLTLINIIDNFIANDRITVLVEAPERNAAGVKKGLVIDTANTKVIAFSEGTKL